MNSKIPALLFFAFILLVIVAADSGTMPDFVRQMYAFPNGDRVGHVVLYGLLAFFVTRAFPRRLQSRWISLPYAFIALILFSVAEELSQQFFSNRTPDVVDLACSCIGVCVGSWIALRVQKMRDCDRQLVG